MYYVYIIANYKRTVLYTGVTSDLSRRLQEHRNGTNDGFTKKYLVRFLMYYEAISDIKAAIQREKQVKGYSRSKKESLISQMNPDWHDLSDDWG